MRNEEPRIRNEERSETNLQLLLILDSRYLITRFLVMVQIDVRQAFQPDFLAGVVSLERLTYVKRRHHQVSSFIDFVPASPTLSQSLGVPLPTGLRTNPWDLIRFIPAWESEHPSAAAPAFYTFG